MNLCQDRQVLRVIELGYFSYNSLIESGLDQKKQAKFHDAGNVDIIYMIKYSDTMMSECKKMMKSADT